MSEVVNIPQLRFPEFNGGWKESRIGKIYKDLRTGSTPSRAVKSYFKGDNPWITSGELKYNRISTTFEQISDEAIKDTNLVLYQPGTLFIAITGLEAPGTRGKCAINAVPSTTNQSCLAFRKVDSVDTIYMFYWYLKYGKPLYFKYAQGTKQQSFNNKIVEKFQIFLPNKPEQQKIAAFLSAVDNKIEQLSKKQELLGEYKKGLMQQIFSQAIRFKADDGSDFPDWKENKVDEFMEVTRGQVLAVPEMRQVESEIFKYPVYSSQTKNNGLTGYYTDYLFEDCITWTTDGANAGDVNYRAGKFYCTNVCGVLRSKKGYANLCIAQILNSVSRRYVSYVGNPKLMNNVMEKIKISIPSSINEQTKIANFLSSVDSKIEEVGKQLDESKQFKKALLQKMFV